MLEFITSPINTFFNWGLSKLNRNAEHKHEERTKLKRLLYCLLELRNWLQKEVFLDEQIGQFMTLYEREIALEWPGGDVLLRSKRPLIIKLIKKAIFSVDKYTATSSKIQNTLAELSEINPLFAHELSDIYNITEKLDMLKTYMDAAMAELEDPLEEGSFIMEDVLRPQLVNDVFVQIQVHTQEVAKMIDHKIYEEVKLKSRAAIAPIDENDFRRFMSPILKKLRKAENK